MDFTQRWTHVLTAAATIGLLGSACGSGDDFSNPGPADAGAVADAGDGAVGVDASLPDATGIDAGPTDLGPAPATEVTVSGQAVKLGAYLAGSADVIEGASILTYGITPAKTAVTDATGQYALTLPANGQVLLFANKAGYFQTYAELSTTSQNISDQRIYLAETSWVTALAAYHSVDLNQPFACHGAPAGALNPDLQCIYAIVVGRLVDDGTPGGGTVRPVSGIAAADFALTYGGQNWYKKGPYFMNADGTPSNSAASVVTQNQGAYTGGLFAIFVEIPMVDGAGSRDLQVSVTHPAAGGQPERRFGPRGVKVFRPYGVSWATLSETGAPPPPPPSSVDFDTQIYPLFLPVNQGGFGCQGCHTNQGGAVPAAGMSLVGGPEAAYAELDPAKHPSRVNISSPDESYLLKRPLYEADGVQDHPIFAFASPQDPAYQLIRTWIAEGGVRNQIAYGVSYYREVRPLLAAPATEGGTGCYACHVSGRTENTAPGGFFMGGTAGQLLYAMTGRPATYVGGTNEKYRVNTAQPAQSLVLVKSLAGNPTPHPVKIFGDATDTRYQRLYQWIAAGATDDRASPDEVTGGAFVPQAGYELHGLGTMIRNPTTQETSVIVEFSGLKPNQAYPVHVHAASCADNVGGGHYKIDPTVADTVEANEIWASVTTNANGEATGTNLVAHLARGDARSLVIHDGTLAGNPKMACADLAPEADVLAEGQFLPLTAGAELDIYGSATLRRWIGGTEAVVSVGGAGLTPNTTYPVHVHAARCADGEGGGHYKLDPSVADALKDNEIWPTVSVGATGRGFGEAWVPHAARSTAWSIVIHDPVSKAKLSCADLRVSTMGYDQRKSARDLFNCGLFKPIAQGTTVRGAASLARHVDGKTTVRVEVSGLSPNTTYPAHVHDGRCAAVGGHYLIDPTAAPGAANEIWPTVSTNAQGVGLGTATVDHYAWPSAGSVVVHDPATNARLACADLFPGGDVTAEGAFIELTAGAGSGIAGTATLRRRSSMGTDVTVSLTGLSPNTTYPAHVHALPCAENEAGGHYFIDPAAPAGAANEIWPIVSSDANGVGSGKAYVSHVARPDAASIVVHDPVTKAKLVCVDLRWPTP
ncbi:MAG: hypothetical protein IPK13_02050 [Deltaproteobacteria bacterium]|nr:hypothetical protein [Deltaproteobacteria bacterium]